MQPWYQSATAIRAWDALRYGVCLVDERRTIAAWNSTLCRWTGYTAAEAVGRTLDELFPHLRELGLLDAIDEIFQSGEPWVGALQSQPYFPNAYSATGRALSSTQEIHAELVAAEKPLVLLDVFDATAHDRRLRAADEDARRRALNEVADVHRKLELQAQELREKNRELYETSLRAEAAARAKSDFLANMSHEIRTPMTAILGFAEVLMSEDGLDRAPPQRRQAITTIQRNGEHLLGILNDILDVSKIESGKMTVEKVKCSPFQIVEDVMLLLRGRTNERGLDLIKIYQFPIPAQVYTDPTRLRQILINLVGNAVKFTDRGSITIRTSYVADPTPRLSFDVIDTGIGISPEQMQRLFQPFTQADSSTTRKYGGTGLGLTICKRMSEMLGGGITLSSIAGEGTTFSFWVDAGKMDGIPLRDCERNEPPTFKVEAVPGRRSSDCLPGCRILLAEDGPDNQRLISLILRKVGAEVTIVENGLAAVETATNAETSGTPFDIVLMDMQMPLMDGYEASAMLREARYPRPIIALTANAMTGDREKCLAAGCDDFATKPIDRQCLFDTIAKNVQRSKATDSAATNY